MKILHDNIVLSEAAKISTNKFDVNIFRRGKYTELDSLEREYVESKDKLEALRMYMERFIIKYKGKKTQYMIKYHETDKNGLFLSMTSNRVKILKEEMKKDKNGFKDRLVSYRSNYTKDVKEVIGDYVNIIHKKSDDNRSYNVSSKKIKDVLNFNTKYTVKDAVSDLKRAFENKLLTNTLNNEMYFNIKRMQSLGIQ